MTVPEENRPKTKNTDQVVGQPTEAQEEKPRTTRSPEGRTLREAMEEAGIEAKDFEDR